MSGDQIYGHDVTGLNLFTYNFYDGIAQIESYTRDAVGRYPTIKLGNRKVVSKRIIQGIDKRRTGMRTQ